MLIVAFLIVMLSFVSLDIVMLSIVILSVVILSVVAPFEKVVTFSVLISLNFFSLLALLLDTDILQVNLLSHFTSANSVKRLVDGNETILLLKRYLQNTLQWKRIRCKQSARWQHLSWLKASAFLSLQQKILVVKKHYNLYLRLVMPSGG
jgi:hypothetical protein